MMVRLAMYKGNGNWFNRAIRWWTGSIYSHCELLIGGNCYSSSIRDGGVRAKTMALPSDKWDVLDLPWADDGEALDWFGEHETDRYGYLDLITSQVFGSSRDGRGEFCSEACGKALGLLSSTRLSPQGLLDVCLAINKNAHFSVSM